AFNTIDTNVDAYLAGGDFASTVGNVALSAAEDASVNAVSAAASVAAAGSMVGVAISGAGAEATNVILGGARAFAEGSSLDSAGDVSLTALNSSDIEAKIVTATAGVGVGIGGAGASLGAAVARNFIGH